MIGRYLPGGGAAARRLRLLAVMPPFRGPAAAGSRGLSGGGGAGGSGPGEGGWLGESSVTEQVLRANQAASLFGAGSQGQGLGGASAGGQAFRSQLEDMIVARRTRPSLLVLLEPVIGAARPLFTTEPVKGVLRDAERFVANDGVRALQHEAAAVDLKSALKDRRDWIASEQQRKGVPPSETTSQVSTVLAKGLLEASKIV